MKTSGRDSTGTYKPSGETRETVPRSPWKDEEGCLGRKTRGLAYNRPVWEGK